MSNPDVEIMLTELKLINSELELKLAQKEQDLDDTLYVIYRVLLMLGLNFENIRTASLKQVIKGINKMVFSATTNQEEFAEQFTNFWELAIRIAAKYENRTKQIVEHRDGK